MAVNPYDSSSAAAVAPEECDGSLTRLRKHRGTRLVASIGMGMLSGGATALAALVAGFHGNAPFVWLYLCGPVAWLCTLAGSDDIYLLVLAIATPTLWSVYWLFALMASTPSTAFRRFTCLAVVHLLSAGAYHVAIGLV